jgi:hypothetical protein
VAAPELRPLGIGEILDVAIKITLRHWKTFVGLVVLTVAPVQLLVALIDMSVTDGAFTTGETEATTQDDLDRLVGGTVLIIVLSFVSGVFSTAVAFRAVVEAYLGGRPHWKDSLRFVARRLHSLLWLALLAFVLLLIAALPCFIPAIWLGVAWVVAVPALLTEDVRGLKALTRSFRLVRGRWWPSFGLLLIGVLLVIVIGGLVELAFTALFFVADTDLAIFLVNAVGGTLGNVITTPFVAAFITVLYVDLRVRKEGLDLQLLAERVGAPVEAPEGPLLIPAPVEQGGPPPPEWEGEPPPHGTAPHGTPPPGWKPAPRDDAPSES